jgi:hypothetical protein
MLEHIHVCDSCKKEERTTSHGDVIGIGGPSHPVGWSHIGIQASVPYKDPLTDLAQDTKDTLKEVGVPKKLRKKYASYLEQLSATQPAMTHRHDHFDLCAECTPKLLAFFATMSLSPRPVPQLGLVQAFEWPPFTEVDDEQSEG